MHQEPFSLTSISGLLVKDLDIPFCCDVTTPIHVLNILAIPSPSKSASFVFTCLHHKTIRLFPPYLTASPAAGIEQHS